MDTSSMPRVALLPETTATAIAVATGGLPAPRRAAEAPTGPSTGELAALDQLAAAEAHPYRPEHLAAPTSPVGRTNADPRRASPLVRLTDRMGRPLVDLSTVTDAELHALTDLLLAEKHRRAARWFDTT